MTSCVSANLMVRERRAGCGFTGGVGTPWGARFTVVMDEAASLIEEGADVDAMVGVVWLGSVICWGGVSSRALRLPLFRASRCAFLEGMSLRQ